MLPVGTRRSEHIVRTLHTSSYQAQTCTYILLSSDSACQETNHKQFPPLVPPLAGTRAAAAAAASPHLRHQFSALIIEFLCAITHPEELQRSASQRKSPKRKRASSPACSAAWVKSARCDVRAGNSVGRSGKSQACCRCRRRSLPLAPAHPPSRPPSAPAACTLAQTAMARLVAVTGGGGYVATELIHQLLVRPRQRPACLLPCLPAACLPAFISFPSFNPCTLDSATCSRACNCRPCLGTKQRPRRRRIISPSAPLGPSRPLHPAPCPRHDRPRATRCAPRCETRATPPRWATSPAWPPRCRATCSSWRRTCWRAPQQAQQAVLLTASQTLRPVLEATPRRAPPPLTSRLRGAPSSSTAPHPSSSTPPTRRRAALCGGLRVWRAALLNGGAAGRLAGRSCVWGRSSGGATGRGTERRRRLQAVPPILCQSGGLLSNLPPVPLRRRSWWILRCAARAPCWRRPPARACAGWCSHPPAPVGRAGYGRAGRGGAAGRPPASCIHAACLRQRHNLCPRCLAPSPSPPVSHPPRPRPASSTLHTLTGAQPSRA